MVYEPQIADSNDKPFCSYFMITKRTCQDILAATNLPARQRSFSEMWRCLA
jgi:hypothetical protein